MSLDDLERIIAEVDSKKKPPRRVNPAMWLTLPVIFFVGYWFYFVTSDAFCTIISVILLSYFLTSLVQALIGGPLQDYPPEREPPIDIPEEFEGRPKLFLAYLIEQAAEQEALTQIVKARGPGMDPSSKSDMWDRI